MIGDDKQLNVCINDSIVFEHQLKSDIGLIGGVSYIFDGVGKVKSAKFRDENHHVDLIQ